MTSQIIFTDFYSVVVALRCMYFIFLIYIYIYLLVNYIFISVVPRIVKIVLSGSYLLECSVT